MCSNSIYLALGSICHDAPFYFEEQRTVVLKKRLESPENPPFSNRVEATFLGAW